MKCLIAAVVILLAASIVHAGYGAGDPRLSKLYSSFMAPCCYGGDLTLHNSPTASDLRARIATLAKDGKSDEEIRRLLVGEYGKQILAVPEGGAHAWLFSMPGFFSVLGLIVVFWFLKRMRRAASMPAEQGS